MQRALKIEQEGGSVDRGVVGQMVVFIEDETAHINRAEHPGIIIISVVVLSL